MKVVWNSGDGGRCHFPGRRQDINLSFTWAGTKRYIPALFRFPQGIVFDLITPFGEAVYAPFYEKYKDIAETLSPAHLRQAEGERPYPYVGLEIPTINGKRAEGMSGSGWHHLPSDNYSYEDKVREYPELLKNSGYFLNMRYMIRTNRKTASWWRSLIYWLFPERIDSFEMRLQSSSRFFAIERSYELPANFEGIMTEAFEHPVTGERHLLHFQQPKADELKIPEREPMLVAQLAYEIEPELPAGEALQFDSSIPPPDGGDPNQLSISYIGIIGSSSSTTADKGAHGLPLRHCFSRPAPEPAPTLTVSLEGVETPREEGRTLFWRRGEGVKNA